MRLSPAYDNRLLLAGVAASLALVAYLAVAFANTHAADSPVASGPGPFAPWVPKYHSTLAAGKGGGTAVHVSSGWIGAYGAVVPTLVAEPPPGRRLVVGLGLRAPGHSPIEVMVDEFPEGPKIIDKMVPATRRWHRYTFSARIKGRWLGLGMYVGSSTDGHLSRWFATRGLTAKLRSH
ncbi:MAG TPA: hypothetical protein VGK69_04775 [Gaiellaceae bacterium]